MAATLRDLEAQLAQLTDAEKAQLMLKLLPALSHAFAGIERKPGVCGGEACVVRTRIPAWTIERYRRLGWTEAQILDNFPALRAADLVNVWAYVDAHADEIETAIRENDEA